MKVRKVFYGLDSASTLGGLSNVRRVSTIATTFGGSRVIHQRWRPRLSFLHCSSGWVRRVQLHYGIRHNYELVYGRGLQFTNGSRDCRCTLARSTTRLA